MMSTAAGSCTQTRSAAQSILVIDDEIGIQVLLKDILSAAGCYVRTARSLRHALSLLRDEGFDVVITDISLPDGDGRELIRQISIDCPHVQVIAMSGFMAAIPYACLADAGTSATLQKPFTAQQLLSVLCSLNRRQRVRTAAG